MSLIYGSKEDVARTQHQNVVLSTYPDTRGTVGGGSLPARQVDRQKEKNYLLQGQVVSRVRSVSKKYCPLTPARPPAREALTSFLLIWDERTCGGERSRGASWVSSFLGQRTGW